MAVVFQNASPPVGVTGTGDTSFVCDTPANTDPGDLLLFVASANQRSFSSPGWTSAINGEEFAALYRVAESGEPAAHTFSFGTFSYAHGVICRFKGHDVSGGLIVGSQTSEGAWTNVVPISAGTVDQAGSGWVALYTLGQRLERYPVSCSRAGAIDAYSGFIDDNSEPLGVWTEDLVSDGAISGETFTLNNSTNGHFTNVVIIPPGESQPEGPGLYKPSWPIELLHRAAYRKAEPTGTYKILSSRMIRGVK